MVQILLGFVQLESITTRTYNVATFLDSRLCEKAVPELRSTMYYEFSSDDTIPSGALSSSVAENPMIKMKNCSFTSQFS